MIGKSFWALRRKRTGTFEPMLYKSAAAAQAKADQNGMFDVVPLTAAPVREEGGAVEAAVKIATDLHHAYEQLIYGLPKYLEAENLTDEENMIREAWITLDVTAHRLAALAAREEAPASAVDDLVDRFAVALKEKLHAAEAKYGHDDAWLRDDWRDDLIRQLGEHVQKGDPRDVAAYCAFAWHHAWSVGPFSPLTENGEAPAEAGVQETLRVLLDNLVIAQSLSKELRQRATDEARSYLSALRAQPPAREDAQPMARQHRPECWGSTSFSDEKAHCYCPPETSKRVAELEFDLSAKTHEVEICEEQISRLEARLSATHPAPEALRVAVEALEPFAAHPDFHAGDDWPVTFVNDEERAPGVTAGDFRRARQALAALQAEQKGGA